MLNLISYNRPPSFIPSFNLDSGTISLVFLLWRLDDLDVDTPLIHLGQITPPPKKIVCLSSPDDLDGSTILKLRSTSILAHVSHVRWWSIICLDLSDISMKEAAPEIMTHLKKFTALSVLEFAAVDDSAVNIPNDRATILLCGEACKSLASITLSTQIPEFTGHYWLTDIYSQMEDFGNIYWVLGVSPSRHLPAGYAVLFVK